MIYRLETYAHFWRETYNQEKNTYTSEAPLTLKKMVQTSHGYFLLYH